MDAGLHAVKTTFKDVIYKTNEFLGNKIADAVTKPNDEKITK